MTSQPDKNTTTPAIISFKKLLVAYHNGDSKATTEALEELNSYSKQEIKELGETLEYLHAEVRAAEQEGAIDALSEKYAADVEAAKDEANQKL